ncbi:MAG: hypothetical protein AAB705_04315, partial [Patescibacteria group bacterium]
TASGGATIVPTNIAYNPPTLPVIPLSITTTPAELKQAGSNVFVTIFSSLSLIIIGGGILLAF